MILTVNIGNTNITIGVVKGKTIVYQARLRTDATKTSDEYAIDLKMLLSIGEIPPAEIEGAIVSSVVPQVLNAMKTALVKLFSKNILVVGPGIKTGLNIRIDNPGQTGADLVVGCVAALKLQKPPLIVINMGTATTLMVLDGNGALIGGSICPGIRISMEALTQRAALLPGLQLDQPKRTIGHNTIECMRSGIMVGAAAMLDGMVQRMEEELGAKATVIATGRIGQYVVPLCKTPIRYERDLLIHGLAALYRENTR